MLHSDHSLNLPVVWFTGKQWADGTAAKFLRQQYKTAVRQVERDGKRARRRFADNAGLSPVQICHRALTGK